MHARNQGAAAFARQNAIPPEVNTKPTVEAPEHPMTDIAIMQANTDTETDSSRSETEEEEEGEGSNPSLTAATIVVANNHAIPTNQRVPSALKAIKAQYRKGLCPEPAEPSSEPIMATFRPSARQRSPPSSFPLREQSPTKTRRLKAPSNYGRE